MLFFQRKIYFYKNSLKDIIFCMLKEISFPIEFLKGHYDSNDISSKDISFWMPRCVKGSYLSNEIFLKEHYLWSNIFKGHYFSKYILSKRIIFFERHFCQKTLSFKKHYLSNDFLQRTWFSNDIFYKKALFSDDSLAISNAPSIMVKLAFSHKKVLL